MKTYTFFLVLLMAACNNLKASNYYSATELTVVSSSGSIEVQVYDYDLAMNKSQTISGTSGANYINNSGVLVYATSTKVGYITYDAEIHQFKEDYQNATNPTISNQDGVFSFAASNKFGYGIYDISINQWKYDYQNASGTPVATSADGIVAFADASKVGYAIYDPTIAQWKYDYQNVTNADIILADGMLAFAGTNKVGYAVYDASNAQWKYDYQNASGSISITNSSGMLAFIDDSKFGYATYDPTSQQFKYDYQNISNPVDVQCQGRIAAAVSSNKVVYATYDASNSQWKNDYQSGSINTGSFSLTNGSITYQNSGGTGYIYGYNSNSHSWGTNATVAVSSFYLTDRSTSGNRLPIIHVRNMSVGAGTVNYNFGDGTTATNETIYHLYKVNGHYQKTANSTYSVCLTANVGGSSPNSCQSVTVTESGSVGIDNIGAAAITCYPNPATNQITISGIEEQTKALLYNNGGMLCINATVANNGQIDISSLPNGLYILELKTAAEILNRVKIAVAR